MAQTLAVKYRPKTFEEVAGQTITTKIINKVLEKQTFKNAYLFTGPSGCGKTSMSRLFAKYINNGVGEPIEIDAASNNGVDQVRAIIESANQRSLTGTYKIYIIDECHMITSAGWNAFLKGIEETPEYKIFIFCLSAHFLLVPFIFIKIQKDSNAAIRVFLFYFKSILYCSIILPSGR